MAIPFAEPVTRYRFLQPIILPGLLRADPPGPESLDEKLRPVRTFRLRRNPLQVEEVGGLSRGKTA